ncbi:hypothetical protein SLNWT_3487 [Streptomyces albus]|uniref:Uncharacterized protein n=1 Tax=Streptomyces albus (strain ATCC 21838 / DSM 41398 / FERM P-419 / JCM 4703 / NBRC 107858) TaxID=1081613 RepID=A0A0B5EMW8_STRA4|nr:hypothetical protein SLNWT_3487 [Streptomyces albus]AOU78167.1 hypothetical protein SLNHY_3476 [Streptomyces albus]
MRGDDRQLFAHLRLRSRARSPVRSAPAEDRSARGTLREMRGPGWIPAVFGQTLGAPTGPA